jgi:hypothetical protein
VYVYSVNTDNTFTPSQELVTSPAEAAGLFGSSIAIADTFMFIGAPAGDF